MDGLGLTKQNILFPNTLSSHQYYIEDDLLYDCIGIGRGCGNEPTRVTGFNSGKDFGYALLTYFTSRALNIQRFPLCEDRIYSASFSMRERYSSILSQLDEMRIESICNEIRCMYENTQKQLREKSIENIVLGRRIKNNGNNYVESLITIKKASEYLGLDTIKVEMDTLNSFGDEGAYFGEVFMKMNIQAKDVLYCSNLIANRKGKGRTVETGEWVIINRSPTGVNEIPTSEIIVDESLWQDKLKLTRDTAEKILNQYNPYVLRGFYHIEPSYGSYGLTRSLKWKVLSFLDRFNKHQ